MLSWRLVGQNLYYKVQEIMNTNSYTQDTDYTLVAAFPNKSQLEQINKWPCIVIETNEFFGRDVELGSQQWGTSHFFIDILARTKGQKEDIAYLLYSNLNEKSIAFYDFNSGFPTSPGNYSGITRLGEAAVQDLSIHTIEPDEYNNVVGEIYHAMLDGIIYLGSF